MIPIRSRHAPASTRAEELARKLDAVIEEHRRYYPDLSGGDVRDALRVIAAQEGAIVRRRPIAGVVAGVVAAMVAAGMALQSRGAGGEGAPTLWIAFAVAMAVAGVAIAVWRRS